MRFLLDHYDAILGMLGALYALVCAVVALTPTTNDDTALTRLMQRASFLAPRNIGGLSMPGKLPRQREDGWIDPMLVVLLVFAPLLGACGSSGLEVARGTAAGGALAVVAADPILADAYDRATAELEAGTLSASDFDARLRKLDRAERALRSLSSALSAVDLALAAAEDGHDCGIRPALDGAVDAAREALEAFDAAGLDMPALVGQVLGIGAALVDAPECGAAS